jgi:hypothetical protein
VRILPYQRFSIETRLSMDEVMHRLHTAVAAPAYWQWTRPPQPFQGSVTGTSFTIHRVIGYRNSFRPRVAGRIVPGHSATAIECTMTMEPVVQVFMALWLSFAAIGFAAGGIALLGGHGLAGGAGLVPFLFLPFGIAMCTFGYGFEAPKTKRALHDLFGLTAV